MEKRLCASSRLTLFPLVPSGWWYLGSIGRCCSSAFGNYLYPRAPKITRPHRNRLPIPQVPMISNVKHPAWRCLSRGTIVVRATALVRFRSYPTDNGANPSWLLLLPLDPLHRHRSPPLLHSPNSVYSAHASWRPLERLQVAGCEFVDSGWHPMPSTPLAPLLLRSAHSWLVHLLPSSPDSRALAPHGLMPHASWLLSVLARCSCALTPHCFLSFLK